MRPEMFSVFCTVRGDIGLTHESTTGSNTSCLCMPVVPIPQGLRAGHDDGPAFPQRVGEKKFLVTLSPTFVTTSLLSTLDKIAECNWAIKRDPAPHSLHRVYVPAGFSRRSPRVEA